MARDGNLEVLGILGSRRRGQGIAVVELTRQSSASAIRTAMRRG